ncbi:MAG: class I SAM-dependent methyltransferase [Candidatus Kapabacteria bacterium]|nr:class I SAM-dependent methyltransferase [Candidatus Kapabacteria bacterium]
MTWVDRNLFDGEHYLGKPAEFSDKIISRRLEILDEIDNFYGTDLNMIEIGCGYGASMILSNDKFNSCLGIEVFPEHQITFEQLKEKYQAKNCTILIDDISKIEITEQFDRLISFEVVEHLPDEDYVQYFNQVLKKNGLAAISVPNKWWIFETHGAKLPLLPWNRVPFFSWLPSFVHERFANARIYTCKRIENLLKRYNFDIIKTYYITAPMDVLKEGRLKKILLKYIFNSNTTNNPFKSTAILVIARKK